jgi:hypothetical protein
MRHLASIVVLGIALGTTQSAQAQRGPGGKGGDGGAVNVQKLVAELEKLQSAIKDIEKKLKEIKEPPTARKAAPPARSSWGPGGFGRGWGGPSSYGRSSGEMWRSRFERGHAPSGDRGSGRSSTHSVSERLDKIEQELADIKRELRRKR